MWFIRPLSVATGLVLGTHGVAWACSCAEPPPVADAAAASDLVVYAEVTQRSVVSSGCNGTISSADPVEVELEVIEGFVGADAGDTVMVETVRDGASCGVGFAEGERWLVYAEDGQTSLCSRTRLLEGDDDPELEELAEL